VMISNYKTGEILCMVSSPSVDPLDNDTEPEDGAYINRCISAAFTPGSTFKLVTSAAALENYPNLDSFSFCCTGEYDVAGVKIKCTTAHGTENFEQALANSCNCAFANLTVALGQDTMVKYVSDYGFLEDHSINDIPTVKGNYPTEFVGDPELAWSGIGQSIDQVCPYSMLRYVSAIACGGTFPEPTLVLSDSEPQMTSLVNPDTARKMQKLMRNNVISHYDGEVNFPGLDLCAKTGTAETGTGTSHSWFTGYLQDDEHPYAFVSIVENGGYGLWTAGIMMNDILQYAVSR
jgi:Cell division protein FtsI/penicillin-binding protein 2